MKLAEALLERKTIKERIAVLKERAASDARVQEGDRPAENPEELLKEIKELVGRMEQLIVAVNRTNIEVMLPDGRTLMEAIAARDMCKLLHDVAKQVADAAANDRSSWRLTRSEIKSVPTIDVQEWRKKADACAKQYRELDAVIQAANWTVELKQGDINS